MPDEPPDSYGDLLREHQLRARRDSAEYWAVCEQSGVRPDTLLRLRARFATWDDQDVAPLQRDLEDRFGYEVEVAREPDDAGGSVWVLTAAVPVRTWTIGEIDQWTDAMVLVTAERPGAMFMEWDAATAHPGPAVERRQLEQRRTNVETWRQLQAHGVTPTTELRPDANFWAPSRTAADGLSDQLRDDLGYAVEVEALRHGLLRRRIWSVVGRSPAVQLNPDAVDAWTDRMVELAARHGAEFDGWGTEIPD